MEVVNTYRSTQRFEIDALTQRMAELVGNHKPAIRERVFRARTYLAILRCPAIQKAQGN
jgi:hypothetical protein